MASRKAQKRFDAELARSRAQLHTVKPVVSLMAALRESIAEDTASVSARWVMNDGGRAAAGYLGKTGDCVVRAIAIATQQSYQTVYDALNERAKQEKRRTRKRSNARTGVWRTTYEPYLASLGWQWTPTMKIGSGCQVHLRADELPSGRLIARLSGHVCAVIDGIVHDIHDPTREGTRCVYGYFSKK